MKPDYLLERTADGDTLVITGEWTDESENVLMQSGANGLVLNYALGFRADSLEFLKSDLPVRRLSVLHRSLSDLAPIARLGAHSKTCRSRWLRTRSWTSAPIQTCLLSLENGIVGVPSCDVDGRPPEESRRLSASADD